MDGDFVVALEGYVYALHGVQFVAGGVAGLWWDFSRDVRQRFTDLDVALGGDIDCHVVSPRNDNFWDCGRLGDAVISVFRWCGLVLRFLYARLRGWGLRRVRFRIVAVIRQV